MSSFIGKKCSFINPVIKGNQIFLFQECYFNKNVSTEECHLNYQYRCNKKLIILIFPFFI